MAHIINEIVKTPGIRGKQQILSCLRKCEPLNESNLIDDKIKKAVKVKQQLETDIFERENRIKKSTEARKNF